MTEKFGFQVISEPEGTWRVQLPHQCLEWDIAGVKYGDGVSQDAAAAELERFIAEAAEALDALRDGRAFGDAQ